MNQRICKGMEENKERAKRQRQNNFPMFPSPKAWNFRGRKRKQSAQDEDAVSLCSLDISEPSNKRVKPLSRVTSLANLIPPVKATPLKRFSQTLQRSISFRSDSRPDILAPRPWSRNAAPSSTKRRDSKLWSETFDVCVNQMLTAKEIKRQEVGSGPVESTVCLEQMCTAGGVGWGLCPVSRSNLLCICRRTNWANILLLMEPLGNHLYEQFTSSDFKYLLPFLALLMQAYHDPMLKLSIMTEQELNQIFGTLDSLIPLHEELLSQLRDVRKPDGSTEHVGPILVGWLPCLSSYDSYCSNQVAAKALLDHKKQDHRVQDFLQRCLESPFSRKLDLWNFLDIPRSRLVKYPLLLREILRHTPNDNPDQQHLEEAINIIQGIVAEINTKTGESECRYYKERLLYLEEGQKDSLIDNSRVLCCHGELKNNRGVKLHVFLFQEVLVITRAITHNEQLCYQLYRQPIPVKDLLLEDLQDGEVRLGGSLRGAFSNNERIKNFFRVSFKNGSQSQTHSLQANDTFNKQQWLNCIRQAKETVLCAAGQAGVLDSEGPFLNPTTGSREPQAETKLEQMDQSDSESDCSMDTSEVSLDCERMEQTDSPCGNSRQVESHV
ncbi:rho guanine nucleotide exchange factor 3 [Otolemur garnettii]|uniref:rho guanine nucleotide exchange factor 3 n=1 Tax=Otolemur garnettii TaxID=30611 RepID=UPI000C7EE909|nr:rho guanine nucleotide exchange factor 3 [Otolemur garnettii]